jgi:hypothetical protein
METFSRKGVETMNLEVTREDLAFLKMLVSKAEVETGVEIHHARTFEYKTYLKDREKQIAALLARIDKLLPNEP